MNQIMDDGISALYTVRRAIPEKSDEVIKSLLLIETIINDYNKLSNKTSLKASDVLQILHITRPTLCHYVKEGKIKVDSQINGQYRYNKESVYALIREE